MADVTKKTGTVPRGTLVFFSDGEPCYDRMKPQEAMQAISNLNFSGVTTVFVAFGEAISSDFGKKMGFQSTKDVNDRKKMVECMEEVSNSCKEQSQSMKALGSNFFSQAANKEASSGYSQTTAQALEDDDWIGDI
jgi:hypothetical protein